MTRRLEIGLLVALCLFLPLYEAPKSIFWVLYVLTWLANRVRAGDFGGRWDLWDTLIAAWIASGFVVAAFAGLHGGEWHGALDLLRYGSILWTIKRARYSGPEIRAVLAALIASTIIGLAAGYTALWRGTVNTLQLNSVGHVNHTAIYLAIALSISASWAFAFWRTSSDGGRIAALTVNALMLASLALAASRGALAVGLAAPLIIASFWRRGSRLPLAASAAAVAVTAALLFAGGSQILRKFEAPHANNALGYRAAIWPAALAAWERYPWFGVGMGNYSLITPERLQRWHQEAGKEYDARRYDISPYRFSHGHSLYFNTLAERGIVGSGALAAVLVAWLVFLIRHRPRPEAADDDWLLWGSATGAWIVTTGVGLVNTTLHHEQGILAVLLLGLWLSRAQGGSRR